MQIDLKRLPKIFLSSVTDCNVVEGGGLTILIARGAEDFQRVVVGRDRLIIFAQGVVGPADVAERDSLA